jgi:DNA-binding XRE family transcriptional regulator
MNANLKHIRLSRGLLLKEAAKQIDTDPGNLSRIEQGKQCPSVPLARRIAALYEISLDQVFGPTPREAA